MVKKTQTAHYDYRPIVHREPLRLPEGARVAVVPFINIEHFPEEAAGTAIVPATTSFSPDPLNYGWRDFGNRVGLWRIASILEEVGAPASICLNADVVHEYPQIVEEGNRRGWCWMGHGTNNTSEGFLNGLDEDHERELIRTALDRIHAGTGRRPRGWLGPFLTAPRAPPNGLAPLGVE